MKANKVLEKLNITRKTLTSYVKQNKIKVIKMANGFYDYNDADVLNIESLQTKKNRIIIYKNNKKIQLALSEDQIKQILIFISNF